MIEGLSYTLDATAVERAFDVFPDVAQPYLDDAAKVSALSIQAEARSRLQRQLSSRSTGETAAGITVKRAYDGHGWIVIELRDPYPNLPFWLEKGTKKGRGTHKTEPRPHFWVAVALEEGPHLRRIDEAMRQALSVSGLGD